MESNLNGLAHGVGMKNSAGGSARMISNSRFVVAGSNRIAQSWANCLPPLDQFVADKIFVGKKIRPPSAGNRSRSRLRRICPSSDGSNAHSRTGEGELT